MTLIQTFFSDDYVIQVSDRRFTNRDGSVFDDEYTKLVCWNQTFTAGFTGIARMDAPLKKSTAEWIAEVLCDYPVFEYGVDAPRREAETTIRNLPTNWDNKRLAIVVAGFDQRSVPLCAEVANFDHLLAHHGYVIDQVQGTADSNNPDYQMMGIRYVKVPTVPNPS